MPKDDIACSTMTVDMRLLIEEGNMFLILFGLFVSVLGVIIIIERPVALGPDRNPTAVWKYIINISDDTKMERASISVAGHRSL